MTKEGFFKDPCYEFEIRKFNAHRFELIPKSGLTKQNHQQQRNHFVKFHSGSISLLKDHQIHWWHLLE